MQVAQRLRGENRYHFPRIPQNSPKLTVTSSAFRAILSATIGLSLTTGGPMKRTFPLASIDCFRGFAVLVACSNLCTMTARPSRLRHVPDSRLTLPDLDASWYFFAHNLTHCSQQPGQPACAPSKRRRWRAYDGSWIVHDTCLGGKKYPSSRGAHTV